SYFFFFFFQAEDGIRDLTVTGVQTCALPIYGDCVMTSPTKVMTQSPSDPRARHFAGSIRWRRRCRKRRSRGASASSISTRQTMRSEERRVGKEWRYRVSTEQ